MKLLLDTNALIWSLIERDRLSSTAAGAIEDEANDVFVSVVSVWEMRIKMRKGKLHIEPDLRPTIEALRFTPLSVSMEHAIAAESLPDHHRDPFDRMLVVQAKLDDLTLVTSDRKLRDYPIATLPAR